MDDSFFRKELFPFCLYYDWKERRERQRLSTNRLNGLRSVKRATPLMQNSESNRVVGLIGVLASIAAIITAYTGYLQMQATERALVASNRNEDFKEFVRKLGTLCSTISNYVSGPIVVDWPDKKTGTARYRMVVDLWPPMSDDAAEAAKKSIDEAVQITEEKMEFFSMWLSGSEMEAYSSLSGAVSALQWQMAYHEFGMSFDETPNQKIQWKYNLCLEIKRAVIEGSRGTQPLSFTPEVFTVGTISAGELGSYAVQLREYFDQWRSEHPPRRRKTAASTVLKN